MAPPPLPPPPPPELVTRLWNAQSNYCFSQLCAWQMLRKEIWPGPPAGFQPPPCSSTLTLRADSMPPLFTPSHASPAPWWVGGGQTPQCSDGGLDSPISNVPISSSDAACNILHPQCPLYPECPSLVTTATILVSQATSLRFWWLICPHWLRIQEGKRKVKQTQSSRP